MMSQAQMLGDFRRAHDCWNGCDHHARFARCDAGKIFAHHARGNVSVDDRCAADATEPLGGSANRVIGTCGDAVTTACASGQKLNLVDRAGWTEHGNCSRNGFTPKVRRRDRIDVDTANASRCLKRYRFNIGLGKTSHERGMSRRRNQFPQSALQQITPVQSQFLVMLFGQKITGRKSCEKTSGSMPILYQESST